MSPVPSRCWHGGRGPELCQLLGQGGDFAKSPARVGSSSRYQKAAHKHPASCSPGVPGKDRKGHLDARCGLGPSTRGCCSEGAFGKYQRATSRLPAFSDLHLREIFIFASISGRRHREAVVALSSLTPCSAALAGADVAPKTLDTNVWVRSLGSKVCQGSRQVWAAAQPQCRELPSHPLRGRGWSGAAARAWHSLGHAANAQLLGMPRSGEGLRVSLKKRLPKYEAHPGWGRFSRGQAAVPGLPPPARRASPRDRSPPQHGGVRDQERRGEEGLPQTSLSASCLALAFRRADAGPFGDLLGRVQGTPLPFPFLLPLPLSLPGLQPHRDEQSGLEETSNGPSPPVPTSTFLPLCQFLSHIPPSPQAPTAISFPLPQLPGPSPSHCPSSAARSKPARKKPGVAPLSIPRVFISEGPRGARLPRSEAEPGEAARVVP